MSAMIGSLSELLTLLVQSFNLSALFPSFVFILFNYLYVRPKLVGIDWVEAFNRLDGSSHGVILATIIVGLAYFITAINGPLIRLIEGYPLLDQFPFDGILQKNRKHIQNLPVTIDELEKLIKRKEQEALLADIGEPRKAVRREISSFVTLRQSLVAERLFFFPVSPARGLPTLFGNIVAASEEFPERVFGIDSILMWPYLVPSLTKSGYAKFVEREKATLDLVLNSLFVISLIGLELLYLESGSGRISLAFFPKIATILGIALTLWWLAKSAAAGWGTVIRAAFVLHKEDLRQALKIAPAMSFEDEKDTWQTVCNVFRDPVPDSAVYLDDGRSIFSYPSQSKPNRIRLRRKIVTFFER